MKRSLKRNVLSVFVGGMALLALAALGIGSIPWISHAAEEAKEEKAEPEKREEKATGGEICCKAGDTTPPGELAGKYPRRSYRIAPIRTTRSWRRTTLISSSSSGCRGATSVTAAPAVAASAQP